MTAPSAPGVLKALPCPFCGAPGSLYASSDHSTAWEGGCSSPPENDCPAYACIWATTEAEAVAAIPVDGRND